MDIAVTQAIADQVYLDILATAAFLVILVVAFLVIAVTAATQELADSLVIAVVVFLATLVTADILALA